MARRTLSIILLPAVRFLAMANAFLGLIFYEERNGHLPRSASVDTHFFLPGGDALARMPVLLPKIVYLLSGRPKKEEPAHLEAARELLHEELPENDLYHILSGRTLDRKRRKKVVLTPFGKFTILDLDGPFGRFAGALMA